MYMNNVMLDLETMGNRPGAVIVSIGAVCFDVKTGLGATFHERIDMRDAVASGLKMDASTVEWWLEQSKEAQSALLQYPRATLKQALLRFNDWLIANCTTSDLTIWGNGGDFDNVILAEAYHAVGFPLPWKYYRNRCYRTMKSLPNVAEKPKFQGLKHDALADACFQAEHLVAILRKQDTESIAAKKCVEVFNRLDDLVNKMLDADTWPSPSVATISEIRDILLEVPLVRG